MVTAAAHALPRPACGGALHGKIGAGVAVDRSTRGHERLGGNHAAPHPYRHQPV